MVNLTLMGACQLLSLSASPSIFLLSQTLQMGGLWNGSNLTALHSLLMHFHCV
uniref:Uncharacterized protein n=1 Tax=Physcomitrium patens TaxID=3218 RepID=A0A2K1LB03_PHYPA|nr:hypothetical protein PHYPA_001635 [Physcomitrium patens]